MLQDLYDLLILTFSSTDGKLADLQALQHKAGLSKDEFDGLLQYASQVCDPLVTLCTTNLIVPQVLSNLVNFKTFGFTKIVPRTNSAKFEAVVKSSAKSAEATPLWDSVGPFRVFTVNALF